MLNYLDIINLKNLRTIFKQSKANFKNNTIGLKKFESDLYLLELFYGPTDSFKDYAMQFLGRIVDLVLLKRGLKKQIITATSGDTGPAAIYGFKDCNLVDIKVYYPKDGVSQFQKKQMLSVKRDGIEVIEQRN
jgi:threonine synthase